MKELLLSKHMIRFAKIEPHRSFAEAGEDLGIVSQTISKDIGELESKLGVKLHSYNYKDGLKLTEEGHVFHELYLKITHEIGKYENNLKMRLLSKKKLK